MEKPDAALLDGANNMANKLLIIQPSFYQSPTHRDVVRVRRRQLVGLDEPQKDPTLAGDDEVAVRRGHGHIRRETRYVAGQPGHAHRRRRNRGSSDGCAGL